MIDFTPWDQLLQKYVKDGRVDYAGWQQNSATALDEWLLDMQSVDLDALDRESGIAFLINIYNAIAIQQVLQKYPIDSIRLTVLGVPNLASFLLFFKKTAYTLNGQSLSLDNIEHDTLRARYDESRIHFALVCVSASCPLLRANAYFPEQLETQLAEEAQRFINNLDKVRYDASSQTLYCSKIFKWYEEDFLAQADSIAAYLQPYLDVQLPTDVAIAYLPYSWQLNDQRISS